MDKRIRLGILIIFTVFFVQFYQPVQKNAYAALPAMEEISETQYYGRNALKDMENGESLLFVYDAIASGVNDSQPAIKVYDDNHSVNPVEIKIVFDAYINDYPQHFWVQNGYSYSYSGTKVYNISPSYSFSGDALAIAKTEFNQKVSDIIEGIDMSMSEFERELLVHDRIANKVTYVLNADNAHSAYGVFVDGEAVCEGYARAFQYALYKVGIQATTVTGVAGGPHAWTLAKIDGKYYYVDLTWDDQSSRIYHAYFNLPLSEISRDHTVESDIELPDCIYTESNYFKVFGGWIDSYNVDNISEALRKNMTGDIYLACETGDFWSWFNSNIGIIASNIGVNGGYSVNMNSMGQERILTITGSRASNNVENVLLEVSNYEFDELGKSYQLKASVKPSTAYNSTVTFFSKNTDVAIVNKYTGLITSVGEGETEIVATSEDGNKTAICKVSVNTKKVDELKATLTVDGNTSTVITTVGNSVTLSAGASGGTAPYTYKYVVANATTGKETTLKDYSSEQSYNCKIANTTEKVFVVYVKDATGTVVASNKINVKAESVIKAQMTINGSTGAVTTTVGSSVTLSASASGGTAPYTYKYVVANATTGKETTLKDYSSAQSYNCKIANTTEKVFVVYVKDATGTVVASNKINVKASTTTSMKAQMTINGSTDAVTTSVGSYVILSASASGGRAPYTFKYVVANATTGKETTLKDYSGKQSYNCKIANTTEKVFVVYVKDSTGTIVASNRINVHANAKSTLAGTLKVGGNTGTVTATLGSTVKLTTEVTGGSGSYQYKYVVSNATTGKAVVLKDYSSEATYDCKIANMATKDFVVYIKDGEGNIVSTNIVNVKVTK